jgi:hypothetical protein
MFKIGHPRKKKQIMERTVPIIQINKPSYYGRPVPDTVSVSRVYIQDSLDRIIEIFNNKQSITGDLAGNRWDAYVPIFKHEYTHTVTDIFQEDDFLMVSLRFVDNIKGREALKIFGDGLAVLRPTIKGQLRKAKIHRDLTTVDDIEIIDIYDLVSIDLIPLCDEVLPQDIDWVKITR